MVYKFFDKKTAGGTAKNEFMQNNKLAEGYTKQLLENLKNKKRIQVTLINYFNFYYVLLIFIVNIFVPYER